jgi:hypothetical protein
MGAAWIKGTFVAVLAVLALRMKTVGNGRKRNYNVENESGRYGIFLYFSN